MPRVEGPFFPDWEFPALFGFDRAKAAILASWPVWDDGKAQSRAINNTLNNLLGYYPHKKWALWPQYISASPEEVKAVFARWRKPPLED
ncbi:hypothetical protein [Myxococcus xanthus]|uniref:hypothetical protein n=1 Tax=Myxococcus xanthus TaxID=34 RepID=UPI0021E5299B|nr:hypothetical protein [Myxococcus xanthus]UYI17166.1 hypothetical protein N3T43_12870 [Myxococcus xanthus]